MDRKKVVVIGCGAAGMMAAISAAREGAYVTVLEAMKSPGRKLLLTGNSRCNLTNLSPRPESRYQSTDRERVLPFVKTVLDQMPVSGTLDLFHDMGLLTTVEHDSYVYPVTGQSRSVLSILLEQMRELGVKLKFSEKAEALEKSGDLWLVRTKGWQYEADSVIITTGGRSFPQTGSDESGYRLLTSLGIGVTDLVPGLTGISVRPKKQPVTYDSLKREEEALYGNGFFQDPGAEGDAAEKQAPTGTPDRRSAAASADGKGGKRNSGQGIPEDLAGLRVNAGVSVYIDGIPAVRDIGQLQFTASDLSGIVVFQVSSQVSRALKAGKTAEIRLDLLPNFTEDEVETLIRRYGERHPDAPLKMAFAGLIPQQMVPEIFRAAGVTHMAHAGLTASGMDRHFIRAVSETIKSLRFEACGVRGFDSCQVTAGGACISEVSPDSLRCVKEGLSGIYLAGEVLDVDGPCGGYNLQWAWSSGYVAGCHAARQASNS